MLITACAASSCSPVASNEPSRKSAFAPMSDALARAASRAFSAMSSPTSRASVAPATHRPGPPRPQPTSTSVCPGCSMSSRTNRSSSETVVKLCGSMAAGYSSPRTSVQIRASTRDGGPAYACWNRACQSCSTGWDRRFIGSPGVLGSVETATPATIVVRSAAHGQCRRSGRRRRARCGAVARTAARGTASPELRGYFTKPPYTELEDVTDDLTFMGNGAHGGIVTTADELPRDHERHRVGPAPAARAPRRDEGAQPRVK